MYGRGTGRGTSKGRGIVGARVTARVRVIVSFRATGRGMGIVWPRSWLRVFVMRRVGVSSTAWPLLLGLLGRVLLWPIQPSPCAAPAWDRGGYACGSGAVQVERELKP